MSDKTGWAIAYDIFVGIVRVGTNVLAVPVWAGILYGAMSLFSADSLWTAASNGFSAGLEWAFHTPLGGIITGLFGIFGLIHAIRLAIGKSQYGILGFLALLIDNTWSLPNTVLGSVFATITLGISVDTSASEGSGRLILSSGLVSSYDTTFGSVTAGKQVLKHEFQHVIQAWLFGPFFYPIFGANYLINLLPFWWLLKLAFNIYPNAPIENFWHYFSRGVYPFTLFELWAYAVEGSPP